MAGISLRKTKAIRFSAFMGDSYIAEEILHQIFSPCGSVDYIVMFHPTSELRAVICFHSPNGATSAKFLLDGRNIWDGCCRLKIQDEPWEDDVPNKKEKSPENDTLQLFDESSEKKMESKDVNHVKERVEDKQQEEIQVNVEKSVLETENTGLKLDTELVSFEAKAVGFKGKNELDKGLKSAIETMGEVLTKERRNCREGCVGTLKRDWKKRRRKNGKERRMAAAMSFFNNGIKLGWVEKQKGRRDGQWDGNIVELRPKPRYDQITTQISSLLLTDQSQSDGGKGKIQIREGSICSPVARHLFDERSKKGLKAVPALEKQNIDTGQNYIYKDKSNEAKKPRQDLVELAIGESKSQQFDSTSNSSTKPAEANEDDEQANTLRCYCGDCTSIAVDSKPPDSLLVLEAVLNGINIVTLRHLQTMILCYCLGDIFVSSFRRGIAKLRLERGTAWMTDNDLEILTHSYVNLDEISFVEGRPLHSKSLYKQIHGLPSAKEPCETVPAFKVVKGSSHAENKLAKQEFMILPDKEGFNLLKCAIDKDGYARKFKRKLNVTTSEFLSKAGSYDLIFKKQQGEQTLILSTQSLGDLYKKFARDFSIVNTQAVKNREDYVWCGPNLSSRTHVDLYMEWKMVRRAIKRGLIGNIEARSRVKVNMVEMFDVLKERGHMIDQLLYKS